MSEKKEVHSGKFDLLKSMNRKKILDLIAERTVVSKSEIVRETGFTMPTVTRITDEFIRDGLVKNVGKGNSQGGRKPVLLSLNTEEYYFIGVYASSKIRSVVTDINGEIKGISRCAPDEQSDIRQIVNEMKTVMEESIQNAGITPDKIAYAGIGIPGIGFKSVGRGHYHSFSAWVNTSYEELYRLGNFSYPVVFANAVRMGAVGELKFGIGCRIKNFLYIHVGAGIGMGAVIDGVLQNGSGKVGGEFGHTVINYAGPVCYCGNRGCVESYCSTGALLKEYAIECVADQKDAWRRPDISFREFVDLVNDRDELACRVAKRVGEILGIGVGNMINLYNPEAVVFGGEVSFSLPLYVEHAVASARKHIFIKAARQVEFYTTEIQDKTENLGAAANAIGNFMNEYCDRQ